MKNDVQRMILRILFDHFLHFEVLAIPYHVLRRYGGLCDGLQRRQEATAHQENTAYSDANVRLSCIPISLVVSY